MRWRVEENGVEEDRPRHRYMCFVGRPTASRAEGDVGDRQRRGVGRGERSGPGD